MIKNTILLIALACLVCSVSCNVPQNFQRHKSQRLKELANKLRTLAITNGGTQFPGQSQQFNSFGNQFTPNNQIVQTVPMNQPQQIQQAPLSPLQLQQQQAQLQELQDLIHGNIKPKTQNVPPQQTFQQQPQQTFQTQPQQTFQTQPQQTFQAQPQQTFQTQPQQNFQAQPQQTFQAQPQQTFQAQPQQTFQQQPQQTFQTQPQQTFQQQPQQTFQTQPQQTFQQQPQQTFQTQQSFSGPVTTPATKPVDMNQHMQGIRDFMKANQQRLLDQEAQQESLLQQQVDQQKQMLQKLQHIPITDPIPIQSQSQNQMTPVQPVPTPQQQTFQGQTVTQQTFQSQPQQQTMPQQTFQSQPQQQTMPQQTFQSQSQQQTMPQQTFQSQPQQQTMPQQTFQSQPQTQTMPQQFENQQFILPKQQSLNDQSDDQQMFQQPQQFSGVQSQQNSKKPQAVFVDTSDLIDDQEHVEQQPQQFTQQPERFEQQPQQFTQQPERFEQQPQQFTQQPERFEQQSFETKQIQKPTRKPKKIDLNNISTSSVIQTPVVSGGAAADSLCAGKVSSERVAHPNRADQFIICHPFGSIVMACPDHTLFNPRLDRCDSHGTRSRSSPCATEPCQNGGMCQDMSSTTFQCTCPPGFSGPTCEQEDVCMSNPCGQGNTCIPLHIGSPVPFYCSCFQNTAFGLGCDKSVEKNPCLNTQDQDFSFPTKIGSNVFIQCEGSRAHLRFCNKPLVFNFEKQECDWQIS